MGYWDRLTGFDMVCVGISLAMGVVPTILGTVGLCFGCSANFTLPPVLGALPGLAGWGIVKSAVVAFRVASPAPARGFAVSTKPASSDEARAAADQFDVVDDTDANAEACPECGGAVDTGAGRCGDCGWERAR